LRKHAQPLIGDKDLSETGLRQQEIPRHFGGKLSVSPQEKRFLGKGPVDLKSWSDARGVAGKESSETEGKRANG